MKSLRHFNKKALAAASALVALGMAGSIGSASAAIFTYDAGGGFLQGSAVNYPASVAYTGLRTTLDDRNTDLDPNNDVWASLNWGAAVEDGQVAPPSTSFQTLCHLRRLRCIPITQARRQT